MKTQLFKNVTSVLCKGFGGIILLCITVLTQQAYAATYTYDNTATQPIPFVDTVCTSPVSLTFNVTDVFNVGDLDVGLNISTAYRADIEARLISPLGTSVYILRDDGSNAVDWDLTLDDATGTTNFLTAMDTAVPLYDVLSDPDSSLSVFDGEAANGTWTLELCDDVSTNTSTFNSARLTFDDIPKPPVDLSVTQSISTSTPNYDDLVTVTVSVTNSSAADAEGVTLLVSQPTSSTYSGYALSSVTAGSYVVSTRIWSVGSVAAGQTETLIYTVPAKAGTGNFSAYVYTSNNSDPDSIPGNTISSEDDYEIQAVTTSPALGHVPGGGRNICYKDQSELALDGEANTWDKLANNAYFGAGGSVAPEDLTHTGFWSVDAATLSNFSCDIWLGGGSPDENAAETVEIYSWHTNGNHYLIGACDYTSNDICNDLRPNIDIPNGGVSINSALTYNPVGCGGALSVDTFGGASTYFTPQAGDVVLATHDPGGEPAIITDAVNGGTFIFLPDADMLGQSGAGAIGSGATATTDQAKLVLNTFKLALDELAGRTINSCTLDFNNPPGTISGFVYTDSNGDDAYQSGTETPLQSVTVSIYGDPATPADPSDDFLIASVETDVNGAYSFSVSQDNSYRIEIDVTDTDLAGLDPGTPNPINSVTVVTGGTTPNQNFGFEAALAEDYSDTPANGSTSPAGTVGAAAYGTATHLMTAGIQLGAAITSEFSAIENADNASDDGINVPELTNGSTADVTIAVSDITVTGTGTLHAWIDFDGNGLFGTAEYASATVTTGTSGALTFSAYGTTMNAGTTYARFRFTSDVLTSADAATSASNGEVEDYVITVSGPVAACGTNIVVCSHAGSYGDINGGGAADLRAKLSNTSFFGATGSLIPETLSFISLTTIDATQLAVNSCQIYFSGYDASTTIDATEQTALNTWVNGGSDRYILGGCDSDGNDSVCDSLGRSVTGYSNIPVNLINSAPQNPLLCSGATTVQTAGGASGYFTNFGTDIPLATYDDPSAFPEVITDSLTGNGNYLLSGDINMWITPNAGISTGSGISLENDFFIANTFKFAADNVCGRISASGPICPGSVAPADYSDAPASYGSPNHEITAGIHLGITAPDSESSGQASAGADGDDTNGTDDEDGISGFPTLSAGDTAYTIPAGNVSGTGVGTLHAWIDFDGDGSFSTTEHAQVSFNNGAAADLSWTGQSTMSAGTTYARFRLTSGVLTNADAATAASDGEVEDYALTVVATQTLSGIVFEDINYGGGAGRDQVTASGVGINGVTVELYDNAGVYVRSTATANDGSTDGVYSFSNLLAGDYFTRVVSETVSSTRTGSDGSEVAVQTFRTDGTTDVTGEVGGRNPAVTDGVAHDGGSPSTLNTTTFVYSGGTLDGITAQSVTPITVAAADITGVDYGYNFDTIVNTNDSGQGSLGQFVINSNLLTDIPNQGINAGQETSIFMIPDGTGYAGTADHGALDLTTGGIATIATDAGFASIADSFTALDASTQNGASCSPRSLKVTLDGSATTAGSGIDGFTITGNNANVRGFSIGGFDRHGINLTGDDALIVCNHVGLDASGTTATANTVNGVNVSTSENVQIGDGTTAGMNVLSGNTEQGLFIASTVAGIVVDTNFMGTTVTGLVPLANGKHGLFAANIVAAGSQLTVRNNVSSGNTISGLYVINSTNLSLVVEDNLLGMGADGTTVVSNAGHGLHISGGDTGTFNASVTGNTLSGNTQNGVWLANTRAVTLTDNRIGVDAAGNAAGNSSFGIRILNGTGVSVGDGTAPGSNIIANNTSDGVYGDGVTDATITRNRIYANGGLGIDLVGVDPDVTVNDASDADTGPNALLNFPQFSEITVSGTNLTVEGCAPAGSVVELFEADVSPTSTSGASTGDNQFGLTQDYGEGETYLNTFTMPATGTACSLVTDADGNVSSGMLAFNQTVTVSASFVTGDSLTATATIAATGTSEFSPILVGAKLTGIVFEDIDYAGGVGRSQASASGVGVNGSTVELYNSSGLLVKTTDTANDGSNDGAYQFSFIPSGQHYVRVVNDTISSTRSGSDGSELPVQTFRTDGATAVTGEVGGRSPALVDGAGYDSGSPSTLNTSTFVFSSGTLNGQTAQSVTPITVAAVDLTGIDFGFNFDTIVNTNDSGQGSLGQFILNSNLLTDIPNQGINAGQETSIFMIPDGTGYAGTANHGALDMTVGGMATIATGTGFADVADAFTALDASTQNGASCAPRTLKITLDGSATTVGSGIDGLTITGNNATVRGFSIGGYDRHGVNLTGDDARIVCNHIGLDAAGTIATANTVNGVNVSTSENVQIGDGTAAGMNVLSGNTEQGLFIASTGAGIVVDTNYMGTTVTGLAPLANGKHGLFAANIVAAGSQLTVRNNVSSGNVISGLYVINSTNLTLTVQDNLLGMGVDGTTVVSNGGHGLHISGGDTGTFNASVTGNTLSGNTQNGVWMANTRAVTLTANNIGVDAVGNAAANNSFGIRILNGTGINIGDGTALGSNTIANNGSDGVYGDGVTDAVITRNSVYANGGLGIDLVGIDPDVTLNDANDADAGPNALLNFPQFSQTYINGGNLTVMGCAPTGSTIELFESDTSPTSSSGATAGDNEFSLTRDYGEGETYITSFAEGVGEDAVSTPINCATLSDADGNAASGMSPFQWTIPSPAGLVSNDTITATATLSGTGTSEFSARSELVSLDYGDAPGYGDAAHAVDGITYLGTAPDVDTGTIITSGDASDDANDDGVFIDAGLSAGLQGTSLNLEETLTLHIPVAGSGNLSAWIDWNADGDFTDNGEQVANAIAGNNTTLTVVVNVPLNAIGGNTYARFRFSSDSAASSPVGTTSNGEVEDYQITIANIPTTPTSATPASCSNTWTAGGGGYQSTTSQGVVITAIASAGGNSSWSFSPNDALNSSGSFSDASLNGIASLSSVYTWDTSPEDDRTAQAATDAETGALTFSFDVPVKDPVLHLDRLGGHGGSEIATPQQLSNSALITMNNANASATFTALAGTSHFEVTSSSIQRTPNETLVWGGASSHAGADSTRFTSMGSVMVSGTYTDLTLDVSGVGVEGAGADGIEFVVCASPFDYSDAPASYGDASHVISPDIQLGPAIDGDTPSLASVDATADGADDDALFIMPALTTQDRNYGITVEVSNTTVNPGRLIAWLDFDRSGTFENDEAAALVIPAGTNSSNYIVTWANIPFDIQAGTTYLRLRFTTDNLNAGSATGEKSDGEVEDYQITIDSGGTDVSGRVYIDANSNEAAEVNELGIANSVVVLVDFFAGTCRSSTTNGNGEYRFNGVLDGSYEVYQAHGETTPVPQNCGTSFANNPTGYQSTTADTIIVNVSGADETNKNFGEVAGTNSTTTGNTGMGITFEPDQQSEILPGNTAFYTHVFSSEAVGKVSFTTPAIDFGNITNGWAHAIYNDVNCDGILNGAEANSIVSGTDEFDLVANERLCIINKVFAPANVPAQDRYEVKTVATFTYPIATIGSVSLEVTDLTIAGQTATPTTQVTPEAGASRLVLTKSVENLSQGTAEVETLNQAKPGDILKYRIYYLNSGTGPITDLKINDTVPAYTGLIADSATCIAPPPPSGMSCSSVVDFNELNWGFTGSLVGGASGQVSYEIMVD